MSDPINTSARAFIFANGELPDVSALRAQLRPDDWLIAADGGLHHLQRLGLVPHLLIGDLDSVLPEEVSTLEQAGGTVRRFAPEKDETDLELALLAVLQAGCQTVRIAAGLGGRIDQTLGNLSLLLLPGSAGYPAVDLRFEDGREEVLLITSRQAVSGAAGDTLSLIPWLGPARGIHTQGLRYPLRGETLWPERTRGISNVLLGETASISLQEGCLLCVHTRKLENL